MIKRAAIILAGGKGQRFQTENGKWQDKALAKLWGKPLLVHAVESVKDVVEEVVIVVNEEARKTEYGKFLAASGVHKASLVTDLKIKGLSGPLIAIYTGLKSADADYYLTVPADVPMLSRKVANYLFTQIKESYVAVPMWPNGRLETLLMVLSRKVCLKIAEALCQLGRTHPDDIIRGALKTLFISPLGEIKTLDPELKSFVNINSQRDLSQLQPRQGQGSTIANLRLNLGEPPLEDISTLLDAANQRDKKDFLDSAEMFAGCADRLEKKETYFWAALSREHQAKSMSASDHQSKEAFLQAAQNYDAEAKIYDQNHCYLLGERAKSDALWCKKQIK
jgi:molybdenum cofactor guanylyltransferase